MYIHLIISKILPKKILKFLLENQLNFKIFYLGHQRKFIFYSYIYIIYTHFTKKKKLFTDYKTQILLKCIIQLY